MRLRWGIFLVMGLMILLYAAARFGLQLGAVRVESRVHGAFSGHAQWMADITVVLLTIAFFQLTRMLGRLATGDLFSAEAVGHFRGFALWLLITALFGLAGPIVSPFLSGDQARGMHFLLDFQKLLMVAVTLVLFLLARLLERARRLDEEVREFV
jgi:hypothetical protein